MDKAGQAGIVYTPPSSILPDQAHIGEDTDDMALPIRCAAGHVNQVKAMVIPAHILQRILIFVNFNFGDLWG
jgi:hypothetical protein